MKLAPRFKGTILNGKLELDNPDNFKLYINSLTGTVEVVVKKFRYTRSIKQNSYYWMYLTLIEQETGNDKNKMHEFFKRKFIAPQEIEVFGNKIIIPGSSTELDKLEFTEYISKIEVLSGIPAPDPNNYA